MAKYIEAKKAQEALIGIGGCGAKADTWEDGWDKAINTAIDELEGIPAADVRPERHGHWEVGYFHDRVCSLCIHPSNDLDEFPYDYCPHCGAKMDGKDGENNG